MAVPDKSRIRQRFAGSSETYATHAHVQQQAAESLVEMVCGTGQRHFDRILEIGCGAGLLTQRIQQHLTYSTLFLNDLVEDCRVLTESLPDTAFLAGDIERIGDVPDRLDLVISSSTFQWLHDLAGLLDRLDRCMSPDAVLAFSTFGPDNLKEIASLCHDVLNYLAVDELEDAVPDGFEIREVREQACERVFDDPMAVLQHLKKTGVTSVTSRLWTQAGLQDFIRAYGERFGRENGVVLTYHPVWIIARKGA